MSTYQKAYIISMMTGYSVDKIFVWLPQVCDRLCPGTNLV